MKNDHYLATIPTSLISTIIELALIEEGEDPELRKNRISALKGELRKLYQINPNIRKFNRTEALLKD